MFCCILLYVDALGLFQFYASSLRDNTFQKCSSSYDDESLATSMYWSDVCGVVY